MNTVVWHTDPWFLIEQSVNVYFKFFELPPPLVTECSTQVIARKYKVNRLQRGFNTTYFIPNFSKMKDDKMFLKNHNHKAF